MSVDYRLLPRFNAKRARLEAVRSGSLPWGHDPQAVDEVHERWLAVRAKAQAHLQLVRGSSHVQLLPDDR